MRAAEEALSQPAAQHAVFHTTRYSPCAYDAEVDAERAAPAATVPDRRRWKVAVAEGRKLHHIHLEHGDTWVPADMLHGTLKLSSISELLSLAMAPSLHGRVTLVAKPVAPDQES